MVNKIGIFGGSFDPPHLGHFQVIKELLSRHIVDEIWLLPCREHAFGKNLSSGASRLLSLEQLIGKLPKKIRNFVRVEDLELQNTKPSYSYSSLQTLRKKNPNCEYKFIIGSDQVKSFEKWNNYQELLDAFEVLVYPRPPAVNPSILKGMTFLSQLPMIDISSSQIRHLQQIGDNSWMKLIPS